MGDEPGAPAPPVRVEPTAEEWREFGECVVLSVRAMAQARPESAEWARDVLATVLTDFPVNDPDTEKALQAAVESNERVDEEGEAFKTRLVRFAGADGGGGEIPGAPSPLGRAFLRQWLVWAINSGHYDSRHRALLRALASRLRVAWSHVVALEGELVQELQTDAENPDLANKESSGRNWKIGLAAVGGGAAMALTAGLAAPAVASLLAVMGASAAATAAITSTTLVYALFGASGAGLAAYKMRRRTAGLEEFAFREVEPREDAAMPALPAVEYEQLSLQQEGEGQQQQSEGQDSNRDHDPQGAGQQQQPQSASGQVPTVPQIVFEGEGKAQEDGKGEGEEEEEGKEGGGEQQAEAPRATGVFGFAGGLGMMVSRGVEGVLDAVSPRTPKSHHSSRSGASPRPDSSPRSSREGEPAGGAQGAGSSIFGSALGAVGSVAGSVKEAAGSVAGSVKDTAGSVAGSVKEAAGSVADGVSHGVHSVGDAANRLVGNTPRQTEGSEASGEEQAGGRGEGGEGGEGEEAEEEEELNPINSEHLGKAEVSALSCVIHVPGYLFSKDDAFDDAAHIAFCMGHGQHFRVQWESESLTLLGTGFAKLIGQTLGFTVGWEVAKTTALRASLAALLWPSYVVSACGFIDSPWSMALDRSVKAGVLLADVLEKRVHGARPVSLVGFSLGARLVFYCLLELHKRKAYGIVENAYLLGAPVHTQPEDWSNAASVVAGEVVNCHCSKDFVLSWMYRSSDLALSVAGLGEVCPEKVRNVDVSDMVNGHLRYREKLAELLARVAPNNDLAVLV